MARCKFVRKALSCFLAAAWSTILGVASASDTEIFLNSEPTPPNVMFVVDVSGSMSWTDNTDLPNISGQVLWLDANDRNTITDAQGDPSWDWRRFSGRVARWRDKSGHGHDLVGSNAQLGRIANRTSVRFTNDIMTGPDIFGGSVEEATIFFVQQENIRSNNFFLSFNGRDFRYWNRVSLHTPWSNKNWYWDAGNASTRSNRVIVNNNPTDVGDVTTVTAFKSVAEDVNGLSLNSGQHVVVNAGATAASTSGGVRIGDRTRDHELGELIVYDRKLSDEEIASVQNYLDNKWQTRLDRVKIALNSLLEEAEGFNAGLMSYSSYVAGQFSLRNEVKAVENTRQALIDNVNSLYASGGTPTQSAMFEGMRYYRGESPIAMGGVKSSGPPSVVGSCQSNHLVVLTDGYPYGTTSEYSRIGNHIGVDCLNNQGQNRYGGNCGIELAAYMKDNDHYPYVSGVNNIKTHTIGLSINMPWLENMANAGGGGYYAVSSSRELVSAFNSIVEDVFDQSVTFVAPSVTVDQISRLSHRDDTYLALFQPTMRARWPGNLKKYRLNGQPLAIRDVNDEVALSNGLFKSNAHSYWSQAADGSVVSSGGAASQLDADDRLVATYTGLGSMELNHPLNLVHETNASALDSFISRSGSDLIHLLAWARGVDVDDENGDNSVVDTRKHIGDPLHSKPVIATYGGTSLEPDSVIFFGTNEGYLHAINSEDGKEIFSFIPRELLRHLPTFHENKLTTERPYGLDGALTLWVDDANNNGIVDPLTEHAYLYIGMRRGGNHYYALDVTEKNNPKFLWQIEGGAGDYKELGQSWSKPIKSKIALNGSIRDVLIFAGGYDPAQDAKTSRAADTIGNTVFIVDATDGSLIWKTALDVNSDYTNMKYSMPSDVTVLDLNGDSMVDQMYVGDMGGQIWRFDVNSGASSASALISAGRIADLGTDDTSDNRRFFYPPDVVLVTQENEYYLSVAIGSGNRSNPLGSSIDDRFYMVKQPVRLPVSSAYGIESSPATTVDPAIYRPIGESDLYDASANNVGSSDTDIALDAKKALKKASGWLLKLTSNGEKVLGSSVTIDNQVVFTSYRPSGTNVPCAPATGFNRAYVVNLFDATPQDGTNPEHRYKDINVDGIAGTVTAVIKERQNNSESEFTINPVVGLETLAFPGVSMIQRVYWSEYPNF